MLRPNSLEPDRAMLLLVDLQEKLVPLIVHQERVRRSTCKLLDGLSVFDLPVIVTEQYPKGLGRTVCDVNKKLPKGSTVIEKPTFSAWGTAPVRDALRKCDLPQIIVAGVETHVCILQSALDLNAAGHDVFVVADAVGARSTIDHDVALARMRHKGVVVTTVESVLFELCESCESPRFKAMIEVIKAYPPSDIR